MRCNPNSLRNMRCLLSDRASVRLSEMWGRRRVTDDLLEDMSLFNKNPDGYVWTDLIFPTPNINPVLEAKKNALFSLVKKWKSKGVEIPIFVNKKMNIYVIRLNQQIERFASVEIYREIVKLKYPHEIVIRAGEENV